MTTTDVKVNFFSTSKQDLDIGIYGGSKKVKMFGAESYLKFVPIDPQCTYEVIEPLRPSSSSFHKKLPAMNYTVTIHSIDAPAPVFMADACERPGQACFCGTSLRPFDYFTKAKQLTQDVTISQVIRAAHIIDFIYHSAVCFTVQGSDDFSPEEGYSPAVLKEGLVEGESKVTSCYQKKYRILDKEEEVPLVINLFQRYPMSGIKWLKIDPLKVLPTQDYPNLPVTINANNAEFDLNLADRAGTIVVRDLVSGNVGSRTFVYNSTFLAPVPPRTIGRPKDLAYKIKAAGPRTSFPYDKPFQVTGAAYFNS